MVASKRTKKRGGWGWGSSSKQTLPDNCVVFKDHLENLVKEYEKFKSNLTPEDTSAMTKADKAVNDAVAVKAAVDATRKTAYSSAEEDEVNKARDARNKINKNLLDRWLLNQQTKTVTITEEAKTDSLISYYFQMPNTESEDGKYKTFRIIKITKIIKEVVAGNIFSSDKITYKLTGNEYYPSTLTSTSTTTIVIPGNNNDKMMNTIIKIYDEKPDISKAQTADISKVEPTVAEPTVAEPTVGGHTMRKYRRKSTKKLAKSRRRKMRKSVSK